VVVIDTPNTVLWYVVVIDTPNTVLWYVVVIDTPNTVLYVVVKTCFMELLNGQLLKGTVESLCGEFNVSEVVLLLIFNGPDSAAEHYLIKIN